MRQGYGELFTNNNFRNYKGYWDKNTINGEVSITSEDWSFKGHYNHFNLHAEGQLIYKDQSSYLGSLIDFKKKEGTYVFAAGEEIKGTGQMTTTSLMLQKKIKMVLSGRVLLKI